jgi:hypothetical protein
MSKPGSPRAGAGGGICPLVSRHLCDSIVGVGDSVARPFIWATPGSFEPWMLDGLVDDRDIGFLPGH